MTARKRQESILNVPVVETVISQDQIQQQGVTSLTDVSSLAPGLLLGEAPLEIGTQVSIRGIGTTSLDPGIDQSVSLNLDGLQLSNGMAYSVGLFDMAQIEVLKGPQALFFGKNSPAGVISIRTADPGDTREGIVRVSHDFEAGQWRGEMILSGPLSDTLGVRVAGSYSHSDGYFRNHAVPATQFGAAPDVSREFGGGETVYLRGTVLFKPTSDLTARLKMNYTRDDVDGGAPFQLASCPDGTVNYLGIPFFAPGEDCKGDRVLNVVNLDPVAFPGVMNGGRPFTNIRQKFGTLELDYNVAPQLALTSVTGYYKLRTAAMIGGTYNGQAAAFVAAQKSFTRREITQELRLNSDYAGPLNFTLGGFYQDGKMFNDIDLLTNQALGFGTAPVLLTGTQDVRIKSASGFGQLRYKPWSRLEIAVGARYTDERRNDHALTSFTGFAGPYVAIRPPNISSKRWSPELTLTYTATDDLTIFGSLKQGYKSGSYNLIIPLVPGQDNSFGDERVRGGEIGVKARLADRQVFVNSAFYYYNYSGLQVGVNEATEGTGIPLLRTVNAGTARIYGVDFDMTYQPLPVPGLKINAAINWNHARFTSFVGAPCYGGQTIAEGCNLLPAPVSTTDPFPAISFTDPNVFGGAPSRYTSQDLTGLPLTRAPDWQVNLGASYEMAVGNGTELKFGTNGQYTSRLLTDLGPRADFYQNEFIKLNANVALEGGDGLWEAALIANNITNQYTTANCTNLNYAGANLPGVVSGAPTQGPGGSDEVHCTFDRGREITLRLTLHI
ncbi:TonB-dependent receptor [Novosphingobium malaysiense]|uniref:TonB-dependent receptor n=1 Tax=Novosphingobium malaysiense TaxID=1348853 RepID=UPI0018CCC43A|nr:TonB-dependent receptor [Novosphingobium malaysiense]